MAGAIIPGYGGRDYYPPAPTPPIYGSPTSTYQQQPAQPGQSYSGYSNPVNPSGGAYTPPPQSPYPSGYNPVYQAQAEQAAKKAADDAAYAAQAKEAQDKFERDKLLALLTGGGGSGVAAPTVQHPSTTQASQDARAAAFSRAKDQAGQIARASLTAIAEEMAGRGITGSGIEALRDAGALDATASGLVNISRDQAIADAARQAEIDDMIYQGGISQRGQDLANRQSYLSLIKSLY